MRRLLRRWLGGEPQYPAMPPETHTDCEKCGASRTIQRNIRGEIVYTSTQPCIWQGYEGFDGHEQCWDGEKVSWET